MNSWKYPEGVGGIGVCRVGFFPHHSQFMGREPGNEEEIKTYCVPAHRGVTFPMFSKIDVNGDARHPLYQN